MDEFQKQPRAAQSTTELGFKIAWVMTLHRVVDMQRMQGRTDDEIASAVEETYIGAHVFVMVHS